MGFEFSTAAKIQFGCGVAQKAAQLAGAYGRRILLVTGRDPDRYSVLLNPLRQGDFLLEQVEIRGEPDLAMVQDAVRITRRFQPDVILAIGGGSVLDAGKAIAALVPNPGDPLDYLEVVGKGLPLTGQPVPLIAVPTTAGTGSEVTKNAVIMVPDKKVKVSLRSDKMFPAIALVDPELTVSMPPGVTAATGLDALTQVLEPFVSVKANSLVDLFCREGLALGSRYLLQAYEHGDDRVAREAMCRVSLYGGLALANAGLGAVHGFAGPIGGMFSAPHGAVCAALLAPVWKKNVEALRRTDPSHAVLTRYCEAAILLTGRQDAGIEDGYGWLQSIREKMNIPFLRDYGIQREHVPKIVEMAMNSSSMKGNPIKLTVEDLEAILLDAI